MSSQFEQEALDYHKNPRPGKMESLPVKAYNTQRALTLAYTPGVAVACNAIKDNPANAALYTGRANLVAVITNGTAVLGLGNIGALASKPVMEGKSFLFKMFADIDSIDIELNVQDPEKFVEIVQAMEPTFGAVNLEDIKSPECFYVEDTLKKTLNVPVFHDDQHGTAVITGAALLNACALLGRDITTIKVVVIGAGAAGMACTRFYASLGVTPENIYMYDAKGSIHKGRTDLHPTQMLFARETPVDIMAAFTDAHLCLGLSTKGAITEAMLKVMAPSPVLFACANPTPEIDYYLAKQIRPDIIMGTGRSDFPNQINNVSGYPFIFRGALDVQATQINEAMKIAAAYALAALAKEPVPQEVSLAYEGMEFSFGADYIIPTPLDPRLIEIVAPAVALAAMESGVAQSPIKDFDVYKKELVARVSKTKARANNLIESYI